MNSKEGVNLKIICLFSICAIFLIAPLIAIVVFESIIVEQKSLVLGHYKNLALLPTRVKYSLVFSIESLASMSRVKLIPDQPDDNAAQYYNKLTYDSFTDTEELFKTNVPSSYSSYVDLYKAVVYQSACDNVPALNNGTRSDNARPVQIKQLHEHWSLHCCDSDTDSFESGVPASGDSA